MKKFAFVSDFDGTLTEKDFYKIITDNYLKDKCSSLYKEWRNKKIKDVDYLGYVFKNIGRDEKEIHEDIMTISLDPFAEQFIENIKKAGGDFIVVSAGTNYYIDKVFEKHKIKGVTVYSNKAVYKDKGIHFVLDKENEFYSDIYGIDKYLVVKNLKQKYKYIFYAGDSAPDLKAALISDTAFAKGKLVELLKENKKSFVEFNNFSQIWEHVKNILGRC